MPKRLIPALVLSVLPLAALAQQAGGSGVLASFMEGCLESAQGLEQAEDFCKCAAKRLVLAPDAGAADPMIVMVDCTEATGG